MDVITIYLSKLIKLYILNMHDLLYVNYTSVELKVYYLKKKKKSVAAVSRRTCKT